MFPPRSKVGKRLDGVWRRDQWLDLALSRDSLAYLL